MHSFIFKKKRVLTIFSTVLFLNLVFFTTELNAFNDTISINKQTLESLFQDLQDVSTDQDSIDAMHQFYEENDSILGTFLNDMVQTMATFAEQDLFEPSLEPAEEFVERWSNIEESCPQCEVFKPVFKQILSQFSQELQLTPQGGNPLSELYNFYLDMGQQDLGGFESLFQFAWPEPRTRTMNIYEKKRVTGYGKEEGTFIVQRQVIELEDGFITFIEVILNDEVVYYKILEEEATFLHQALEEMMRDNIDTKAIRFVNRFVTLIDQEIALAHNNGEIDNFTRQYLYDQDFKKENLIKSKHPLLKPPYSVGQFDVIKYYQ